MTNITLHGILAHEFGKNFQFKLDNPKDTLKAIDANRENFINRLNDLCRQGLNYTMIVDNKKINDLNEIEMKKAPKEIHLLPLITGSGWYAVIAVIVAVVTATAQYLLTPTPVVPGATGTSKSINQSYSFSNKQNAQTQGSPVPVGYGRLRVGSNTIQTSVKSFQQNADSVSSMKKNPLISVDNLNTDFGGMSKRTMSPQTH